MLYLQLYSKRRPLLPNLKGGRDFSILPPEITAVNLNYFQLWRFTASTNFSYSSHYLDFNFDIIRNLSWELQSMLSTQALWNCRAIGITHSTFKGVSYAWCLWKQTIQACSSELCLGLQNSKQQLGCERVWTRSQKTWVLVLNLPLTRFLTLTKSLNLTVI